jgi:hypothetical protein
MNLLNLFYFLKQKNIFIILGENIKLWLFVFELLQSKEINLIKI